MKNFEALIQAQNCYMSLERYRRDRERNKRYNYGDQWSDIVYIDGRAIKEEDYIREQGSEPLKNNLIRRLVRNVIGVHCQQKFKPYCLAKERSAAASKEMNRLLDKNAELNRLEALYVRSLEEFLIGGLVVHKKWYGMRQGKSRCWTDYVHPNNFFVDAAMRDFRAWDCTCIGEIHDVDFMTLISQFAKNADDYRRLRIIYDTARNRDACYNAWEEFGYSNQSCMSFLQPRNPQMCRVIEVWSKEHHVRYRCHDPQKGEIFKIDECDYDRIVKRENARRKANKIQAQWLMEEDWHYYFLSPLGDVLAHGKSPYKHGSHPYAMKAYPMIDGEIHAFVGDVIDQQRYTNRLITMYDWIVRSSAKGVLLLPEDCIPRGVTAQDFANTWSKFNGVLLYKPSSHGEIPKQVSSNATNVGITELLNIQLKFFEEISGVNGALEGKLANSAMSAELFGQQTQNATMALLDLLSTFQEFMLEGTAKDISNMQKFERELSDELRNAQFEIKIRRTDDIPNK